jgi:hypothetical protein
MGSAGPAGCCGERPACCPACCGEGLAGCPACAPGSAAAGTLLLDPGSAAADQCLLATGAEVSPTRKKTRASDFRAGGTGKSTSQAFSTPGNTQTFSTTTGWAGSGTSGAAATATVGDGFAVGRLRLFS